MKKIILTSIVTLLLANSTYAYTTEMTNSVPPAATTETSAQQLGAGTQAAVTPSLPSSPNKPQVAPKSANKKKSWSNFFGIFDMIGRLETFVKGKKKQNENVIDEAANGNVEVSHKRAIATDPAARKIQEKLDKAQAERLQKLENVVGH
jgi:hypothetical protein